MQTLQALAQDAVSTLMLSPEEAEVDRVMTICNACRYCEGFCAVFPAMTRLLEFSKADIHYLANVCHNCGACLHACQYAAPHEFAVNVPRALAAVRPLTYAEFAWPRALGRLYQRAGLTMALATAGGLALFLVLVLILNQGAWLHAPLAGNFYAIFPHNLLVLMFGAVFLYAIVALGLGVAAFWRMLSPAAAPGAVLGAAGLDAAGKALTLKYLDGGHGEGCNDEDDRYTHRRRVFHHLTFYGFVCCFIATSVATLYHYLLDYPAPYPVVSVPVLFGIVGGIGLLIGPAGLLWLNLRRHPEHAASAQQPMDRGFIALLMLVSATGLALLIWRDTGAMGLWLALHLGVVMAFFLTMPYGKFAHGVFRSAALLRSALDKRAGLPSTGG
ncbi:Tricarballylate utilization 4Fe-4S protein TcuB (Fragment) OS=Castellaniella sp OX=1955812 GN=tcuB PE=4 SV=1 [Castellaniella denitrificans]|uniref:tricarballylate utilization 4Fe-4S protein TcuB n=1 Tax=Castellaniella sp. TaxID=1955812 RepID=UPI002AFF322A|nr:tricarballylate utilization 4Fe-4S protein TcuB [Castellaniella sp.]